MSDKCQRIGGCLHDLGYDHCCCDDNSCDHQQNPQHHIPPALLEALIDLALNPSEQTTNKARAANTKQEEA